MLRDLSSYVLAVRDLKYTLNILRSGEFRKNRMTADIIRLVHSIEKGLCLEQPRLGFGVEKLNQLFALCGVYARDFGDDQFCLKMARDAVKAYVIFHQQRGYESPAFAEICEEYRRFPCQDSGEQEIFGGVLSVETKSELPIEKLEAFFSDRHSIRDFDNEKVPDEVIFRAVRAAQTAPSACNRQAVRVYVLTPEKLCDLYGDKLEGIGGFAENASRFILITGQLSAYQPGEYHQHIVSASIFGAYLMQALFAQNVGACIVQRPLYFSKKWEVIAGQIGIPADERLVFMMAIGYLKEKCSVPVSKRFPTEHVLKFIP